MNWAGLGWDGKDRVRRSGKDDSEGKESEEKGEDLHFGSWGDGRP